ncbi:MAG: hypothetical protein PUC82_04000 [bacterium]|nr:hypothetical protein [bacterium]
MTYNEAKTIVGGGEFIATYSRVSQGQKKFIKLRDSGAFSSTDDYTTKANTSFAELKEQDAPFKSGSTNIYRTLIENYEEALKIIENDVALYLDMAVGYCISIKNGMDTDSAALAAADEEYTRVYDSLAPHIVDETDEKGKVVGKKDLTAEHAATAYAAAEEVWYSLCCVWSK